MPHVSWSHAHTTEQLGAALARARHDREWTQVQLADAVGVDRRTIIRMESGQHASTATMVRALSILGCELIVVPKSASITVEVRS